MLSRQVVTASRLLPCTCRPARPTPLPTSLLRYARSFSRSTASSAEPASSFSLYRLVPHQRPRTPPEPPVPPEPGAIPGIALIDEVENPIPALNRAVDEAKKRKKKIEGHRGGIFSMFMKGKAQEVEEDHGYWSSEAARALERTLKSGTGAKGNSLTGAIGGMNMRCTTLNDKGDVTTLAGMFSKGELCTRYGIQPRDLRKLDSAVPTVVPTILVRKGAILLTILHLRVVITADEVSLFDSVGSEDSWLKGVFIWSLEHALKTSTKASHGLPYEFRALESCLISVTTALENEMTNIRAMVIQLLDGLEDHIERDKLRLLLQYSRKLSAFQKRATLVQECLEEVLRNDEDLAAMYLTAKKQGTPRDSTDHEEIELLLESFSKMCEEIVSEVEGLSANVRHTEDIIELILDANRNSLLGLDLKVSICTLGLTSGALIAGLFGMNLTSRLEAHPWAFPMITASAFAFAGIVSIVGLRRLRKMRKVALGGRISGETSASSRLGWREEGMRRIKSRSSRY